WYLILGGLIITIYLFSFFRRTSQKFSDGVDRTTLKLPIIGNIVYNSIIARFSRTLATTFAAGVPLIDALTSVSGAAGNAVYRESILNIRDDVATGVTMHSCLRSAGIYPSMLIQMTSIGEESGSLDEMLDKVATFYEEEVDNMVDNLTTLLEPMIMAILGVLVGGLMIAMYLPIFQLGQVV
ncbi:MAG: type II secretion system F family protein, partial [Cellvibrionaceae bacterium]|nr:type II secretion system F family protein [Cellvibrionaceae bacterium]